MLQIIQKIKTKLTKNKQTKKLYNRNSVHYILTFVYLSCKGKFYLDASFLNTFSISIDCLISCINSLLLNSL